jgi:hypothetical protein
VRRTGWENESDDLEEIGELARTAGNPKVRISKALNEEAEKKEDPGKREGLESTKRVILDGRRRKLIQIRKGDKR